MDIATLSEKFCSDGYIVVRGAVAPNIVGACVRVIEEKLHALGVDPNDSTTWTEPVVRIICPEDPPFAAAGTSSKLWTMYDLLLGPGKWVKRQGVGGTIPVRFPSKKDPGDAAWHIDGSYEVDGEYWVNVQSRYRGLLALFLFTDVTEKDSPTEIIVGSHLDVPQVLAPYGQRGVFFDNVNGQLPSSTFQRPRAFATGRAGDVYLCHPFLVHRATWPHTGVGPRMVAQPEIAHHEPFALEGGNVFLVEQALMRGLGC